MVKEKKQKVLTKNSLQNQINWKWFVLSSLIIAALLWQFGESKKISLQYLDQEGTKHTLILSVKDKKKLAGLMQKLFAENSFAYTILGSKTVSWETYQNSLPLTNWKTFYNSFSEHNRTIRSGWKTWEKYQHLFP